MRILLVDDDAGAASALMAVLKTLSGHEVRTAATGEEALAAAAQLSGVDLLITDVVMEPMDGFTLRDQLTALYPNLRTILVSGYDLSEYPEQTQNHQLLSKPVDADALREAVAREIPAAPEAPAVPEPTPEATPVAEAPEATPTPAPEPEVAAVAEAAPAPTPVAVPVPAKPVATPVAVPAAAKPVAVPAATPVAVPAAKSAAVPSPRVAVAAKAVPAPAVPPAVKATPVANPTAVPVAAQPKPQAVPAPTAKPAVAAPTATPVAVPATPKVVPAAQPAATPKPAAVPVPRAAVAAPKAAAPTPAPVAPPSTPPAPTATPTAAAAAAPAPPTVRMAPTVKAQPVAPPSSPAGPGPVAAKVPVAGAPVAKATATPVAKPTGAPVAKATGAPAAVPVAAKPAAAVAATPAVTPAPVGVPPTGVSAPSLNPTPTSGEDLSGKMLGAYQLHRKMGESRWGGIYAGTQTSINRAVAIEVLDSTRAEDENAQARFVADARAKAAVQHPSILAVYEAGEAEGRFFYAYEYVDGQTIAELKAAGKKLDEPSALKALRVAADGLSYLNVHSTPHTPPDANSLSLGNDGHPRLANLATQLADETLTPPQEIQALGRVMLGVLPAIQALSPGMRELLKRMVQAGPQAMTSWGQVLQAVKALEPKIVPTDAAKINAQDRAAIAAVEQARKQQKRSLAYNITSVASLIILIIVAVWYFFFHNKQRIHDEQVHIPGGEFIFANGLKGNLPDFWIDKYEVTFGQYAEFVKALEANPTTDFDHKDQPKIKAKALHKPYNWEIYYGQAREGGKAHSTPIDLSCPVLEVDYWDAYAYAKWKGRDLPTEEEWEKAARGTQGFLYPWGNDPDPKKTNSNADFNPNDPAALGAVDGFNFWNPVDKVLGDKSPYGVMGMAGNLREWTGTWNMRTRTVIAKGGGFKSPDSRVDQRVDLDPGAHDEALGFRTVSRTPPTK